MPSIRPISDLRIFCPACVRMEKINKKENPGFMEKVALITGASRGIGRAAARRLAQAGYAVCINYLERRDCAESLASELRGAGCRAMTHQADVADRAAVE